MKRCLSFLLCCLLCLGLCCPVFASELPPDESSSEEAESFDYDEFFRLWAEYMNSQLSDEEEALRNPPDLTEFYTILMARGIPDMSNYPYTGGCFALVNSNLGQGIIFVPENYRTNTFGFMKGTDRIVNLTTGTVNGYWIRAGTTQSLRFSSLGQAQYYYQSGNNWYWGDIVISSLLDTNIQFLDETGERGIQNPFFTIFERTMIMMAGICMAMIVVLAFIILLKRR